MTIKNSRQEYQEPIKVCKLEGTTPTTNQQDISFTRSQEYRNTVETYGMTGTIGIQYQIK